MWEIIEPFVNSVMNKQVCRHLYRSSSFSHCDHLLHLTKVGAYQAATYHEICKYVSSFVLKATPTKRLFHNELLQPEYKPSLSESTVW